MKPINELHPDVRQVLWYYDKSILVVELGVPLLTMIITFCMLSFSSDHTFLFITILLIGVTITVLCIYDSRSTWSLLVYVCTWYFWLLYSYGYFSSGVYWRLGSSLLSASTGNASSNDDDTEDVTQHAHNIFSSVITSDPDSIPTGYTVLNVLISCLFVVEVLFSFNNRRLHGLRLLGCVAGTLFADVIPFADNNMFNRNLFTVLRCVMYVGVHAINNLRYRSYKYQGTEAMLRGFLQIQYLLFGYFYVSVAGFVLHIGLVLVSLIWAPKMGEQDASELEASPQPPPHVNGRTRRNATDIFEPPPALSSSVLYHQQQYPDPQHFAPPTFPSPFDFAPPPSTFSTPAPASTATTLADYSMASMFGNNPNDKLL